MRFLLIWNESLIISKNFDFSESDLDYLKELGYREDYVDFLRTVRFTGTVRAMKEGKLYLATNPFFVSKHR